MTNKQMFDTEETDFYDKKEREKGITTEEDYLEETAAEAAPSMGVLDRNTLTSPENERLLDEERNTDLEDGEVVQGASMIGGLALALSIISLFILPIILGAAGIIVGFMARRRGSEKMGNWAIGIGIVSIVISLFLAPFL